MKPTVLILCTGNSCRSQLAEGILRAAADTINVQSAGSKPAGYVHPLAIQVMKELGLDISGHHSKHLDEFLNQPVETVITVCGNADQTCPMFPGQVNRHHWSFDDPSHAPGTDEEKLAVFRRVRDEIKRVFEAYAAGRCDQAQTLTGQQTTNMNSHSETVHQTVREGYARIAQETSQGCCSPGVSCCGSPPAEADKLAQELGYTMEELRALPDGANMGLSCGNPAALASLQPGEVVLDLGSGGGFDVFIAGSKVGAAGRAIGVDMTPEMLAKARRNVAGYRKQTALNNVEFRLGEIEHLPMADASVDVIISNCVLNLSPDKAQVWREVARVLKPGGRVAISDMALVKPLPSEVLKMVEALVGCVAGAVLVNETGRLVREAGLTDIALKSKPGYVTAMENFEDPLYRQLMEHLPAGTTPADFITSLEVQARKAGNAG